MINIPEFDNQIIDNIIQREFTPKKLNNLLDEYLAQYRDIYANKSHKEYAEVFVKGLLSGLDRKSIEPIALNFLNGSVRNLQQFFTRAPFKDDEMKARYQEMVSNELNCLGGMICVDETDFIKKGSNSAGVARQYCGRLGKTENCQAGVFIAYSGDKGYELIDNQLYIPEKWFNPEYSDKREKSQFPENIVFEGKNVIASKLITKAIESGKWDVKWVGCDAGFGTDPEFLDNLPSSVYYFAGIRKTDQIFREMPEMKVPEWSGRGKKFNFLRPSIPAVSVESIVIDDSIPWMKVILTEGTKGPLYADIKCIRCICCRNTYTGNSKKVRNVNPGYEIWLYIRKYADGTIKYYESNAPSDTPLETLNKVSTMRWSIEQCFEECKSFLGMGHYETQTYTAWHRHMLFVMIAHFFITSIRISLKKTVFL